MKKIMLISLLTALYVTSHAQTRRRHVVESNPGTFSVGLEAGVPVGDNAIPYSSVLGVSLQYETKPQTDLGITFSAGYLNYHFKESYGGGSVGFVPLLVGLKYYFSPKTYFHGQLGAAVGTESGQGTSFAYSPGLGYQFSPRVDGELKFTGISNSGGSLNNVGLRLAYNF